MGSLVWPQSPQPSRLALRWLRPAQAVPMSHRTHQPYPSPLQEAGAPGVPGSWGKGPGSLPMGAYLTKCHCAPKRPRRSPGKDSLAKVLRSPGGPPSTLSLRYRLCSSQGRRRPFQHIARAGLSTVTWQGRTDVDPSSGTSPALSRPESTSLLLDDGAGGRDQAARCAPGSREAEPFPLSPSSSWDTPPPPPSLTVGTCRGDRPGPLPHPPSASGAATRSAADPNVPDGTTDCIWPRQHLAGPTSIINLRCRFVPLSS